MGQYHYPVNFSRREFINPHQFGDGLKLLEFGTSNLGTLTGLAVLLAGSNKGGARGGGDLHPWDGEAPGYEGRGVPVDPQLAEGYMNHIVGRWCGQKIGIIGDYHEPEDTKLLSTHGSPWGEQGEGDDWIYPQNWVDISEHVIGAMEMDFYIHESRFKEHTYEHSGETYTRRSAFGGGPKNYSVFDPKTGAITAVETPVTK